MVKEKARKPSGRGHQLGDVLGCVSSPERREVRGRPQPRSHCSLEERTATSRGLPPDTVLRTIVAETVAAQLFREGLDVGLNYVRQRCYGIVNRCVKMVSWMTVGWGLGNVDG